MAKGVTKGGSSKRKKGKTLDALARQVSKDENGDTDSVRKKDGNPLGLTGEWGSLLCECGVGLRTLHLTLFLPSLLLIPPFFVSLLSLCNGLSSWRQSLREAEYRRRRLLCRADSCL